MADVVERLEAEAGHERRVADDDRDPFGAVTDVARGGEALGDRQAGAGVTAVEDVVLALAAAREAADAVDLPERPEPLQPAREELVGVGLMPRVPDDPVVRRAQQPVQGDGDLDHAEAGAQVAARLRDGRDDRLADLGGEICELGFAQAAEVGRTGQAGEDRAGHVRRNPPCCAVCETPRR
jgi:hypothetical protein